MLKCPKCNKNKLYVCSDNINAWCNNGCGYFAVFQNNIFYIGKEEFYRYCVKQDGSFKKIIITHIENKEIVETERLIDIENKFKEFINKIKVEKENNININVWWSNLTIEQKNKIYNSEKLRK